jgi:outer membrane receptor protein involved in Fe transport
MNMKKYVWLYLAITCLLVASSLNAATTGKLAGRVTDIDTGEPVAGANVIIVEKEMGAVTDQNGRYMILNIPPGIYTVQASRLDYAPTTVEEVRINLDLTTTINFELQKKAIGVEGITVRAEREMVQRDRTSSETIVSSDEVETMPVRSIQEIVAVTAGAVGSGENLHIRGGRAGEVVYTVDGMSISNPVDHGFGMNLDLDAVGDMSVQTGGFTAEFGNAQSAIINLVTRSGGPEYEGKIEFRTDHLFDEGNNYDIAKFSLGGPIIPRGSREERDRFTFYVNGSGSWTDTRYKDYYTVDKNDVLWLQDMDGNVDKGLQEYHLAFINQVVAGRDEFLNFDIGDRFRNNYQGNAKFKFQLNPTQKLSFAIRGDRETYLPYNHAFKYSLPYYDHWETTHDQQALTWDHTISPTMFYTVRASRFNTTMHLDSGVDRNWYFSDENWNFNPLDPVSQNYGVHIPGTGDDERITYNDPLGNEKEIIGFVSPGTHSGDFIDDETTTYTLRGDFTYQVSDVHQLKTGLEMQHHEIYKDRLIDPWNIDDNKRLPGYLVGKEVDTLQVDFHYDPTLHLGYGGEVYLIEDFKDAVQFAAGSIDGYKAYPWQGAYYLQDKMEWEGMIVNAGLRFDFWYLGDDYQIINDSTGKFVDADWDYIEYIEETEPGVFELRREDVDKFQLMISPRLGISHPISERDVLHFAYNYQSQLPPMQYVFTSATPQVGTAGALVGNPNLEPETTITYEAGIEHQMAEDYLLDVTLFYKNIYNLVSLNSNDYSVLPPEEGGEAGRQYYVYVTRDYGSSRGVEFTLRKRFSNFWGFNIGYTYSWATGRNSEVHSPRENLREFPLNWDVRHNGSVNLDFRIPEDEEFYLFGIKMLDQFSANLLWQVQSGQPYTPMSPDPNSNQLLETNSERMPWTNTLDMRLSQAFNVGKDSKIRFFLDINNLFNTKNILFVYPRTGEPDDNGEIPRYFDLNNDGVVNELDDYIGAEIYKAYLDNPANYSEGRTFTFGFAFEW